MQSGYKTWNVLSQLQRQLKKQFLLVEKEQQEKIKLKRQIQQLVRSYHQFYIDLHYPGAELLKDEGFENCYNFIKDVVTGISSNYLLGKAILFYTSEQTKLSNLLIHGLYQNLETNDAFCKDITRLMYSLVSELNKQFRIDKEKEKVVQAWKIYMQKAQHLTYFQQIAYPTIIQLLKQDKEHSYLPQDNQGLDKNKHKKKFKLQVIEKEKLIESFIERVETESQMCLPSIKIPIRGLLANSYGQHNKNILRKIWVFMSYFYLQPFVRVTASNQIPQIARQKILQFVDQLILQWGFTGQLAFQNLQLKEPSAVFAQTKMPRLLKVVTRLIQINQQRMACFLSGLAQTTGQIQIKITGGCLSLIQLRDLLILLNSHKQIFSKINERVINRTIKIFQISKDLQVLNREKPGLQFTSLVELKYQESISSDYYKNYTTVYRDQTLKKMLKQILVETQNIWDLRSEQRNSLAEIFDGLVTQNRQYHTGAAISAQLEMKINYLIYLLGKRQAGGELQLLLDLKQDLKIRDSINIRLFQDTKFSLLKVYCNLRSLKNQIKHQKENERKSLIKISLVHKLQALRLDLCITSKASRNLWQGEGQQSFDKYRYRLSTADDILIQPISQCIHKDNVFTGRLSHANNVGKLIALFVNLQEVKHFISYPTFTGSKYINNRYFYSNQAKIGEVFHNFLKMVLQKLKFQSQDKIVIESVVLRLLSQMLLGTSQSPIVYYGDRLLLQKIELINESKNIQLESPRKKPMRRKGSHQFIQGLPGENSHWVSNESQIYEMGKRYLNSLIEANTSTEKIKKLREMVDMYKIALRRNDYQNKDVPFLQNLIEKSIVAAYPVNFISQLSFIQMFLAEQKLISSDGKVLKQFQKAAQKILKTQLVSTGKKNIRDV